MAKKLLLVSTIKNSTKKGDTTLRNTASPVERSESRSAIITSYSMDPSITVVSITKKDGVDSGDHPTESFIVTATQDSDPADVMNVAVCSTLEGAIDFANQYCVQQGITNPVVQNL